MKKKIISFLISFALNWPKYKARIIDVLYRAKVSVFPMWFLYLPKPLQVTGHQITRVLSILKPGDIILTGCDRWAMQHLIPNEFGYTHSGIYIGDSQVVHAAIGGVKSINVIDFLQCDHITVIRIDADPKLAVQRARNLIGTPYDYSFRKGQEALYSFQLCAICYKQKEFYSRNIKVFGITLPAFCGQYYYDKSFIQADSARIIYEY